MDSPLTNALGWALLHFLWQGAAIALLAWILLRVFRSAGARYLVAILAIALMPLAFMVTAVVGYQPAAPLAHSPGADLVWSPSGPLSVAPLEGAGRETSPRAKADRHKSRSTGADRSSPSPSATPSPSAGSPTLAQLAPSLRDVVADWLPFLVILWLAGVVVLSVRLLGGWSAARRLVREGTRPAGTEYQKMFDRLVERLKVSRAVRLLESTVASVPSVIGWLRPVILLPATALTGLTPAQIELLLAHELAHVRRYDYLINLLQCAVETLLFYHPAIWWLSRRAREERELCCDDIAVAITGDAREYAEALVALERIRAVPQLAMAATGGALLPRIRRLVDPHPMGGEIFPRWIAGGLVVSLLAAGAVSAGLPQLNPIGLPSSDPGSAQPAVVEDTSHKTRQREFGTVDTIAAPDTVISHPDPSRPLAERVAWAKTQNGRRAGIYWIAYSVRPIESIRGAMYIGSATMFTDDGKHFMSGSMVAFGDAGKFHAPGTPLQRLLGGRPDDVAILLGFNGDRLDDPAMVSLSLNFDFHGQPVYWLGSSDDAQSIALTRDLLSRAQTKDQREKLVRLIGAHRSNELVIPILIGVLESGEAPEVRDDAAAWLGRHPRKDALSALDRAARRDRSRDVRKEAAEGVGELELPEAFDVLVKLARELDDAEVRQEAVESLGDRPEADAAKILGDIALHDRDRQVQREATETLGDLSDLRGLPVLKNLVLNHPVSEVREEAVETWADAAPVDQAVDLLEAVIRDDPSQDVRREAVEDLIELRDGKGLAIVRKLAREHRDPELRREAVEDLPPHMPTEEAFAFLKDVIAKDPSTDVRREAVETLGDLKDNRAIPILIEVAQSQSSDDVAREAAETLGEIDDPAAVEALLRIARNHRSDEVMAEAVETLGERKSGDGLSAVADIAANHPRSRVRAEAVETYGENASGEQALALFRKLAVNERDEQVLSEIFETAIELKGADGVAFVMEVVKSSRDTYVRDVAADELKDSDDRRAKALVRELKLDD